MGDRYGTQLGSAICNALGLDARQIRRIAFDWTVSTIGTITIEMYVDQCQGEAMATVLKQYTLVPVKTTSDSIHDRHLTRS